MKQSRRGLGKKLESLIPTEGFEELVGGAGFTFRPIKITDISPSEDQPRKKFADEAMQELISSVETHGILQPIVVVKHRGGYKIVAGERRFRASKHLGHDTIPAIIRTMDDQQRLETALIENLQREDLNPIELAETLHRLITEFNLEAKHLASRVGKHRTTIVNVVRLRNLPEPAKRALIDGRITEGHARAILALESNPQKQQQLLDYILKNNWTVRQAEQFAIAAKSKTATVAVKNTIQTNQETEKLTKKLSTSTPVKVHNMAKGKGRIIIEFKNKAEYKKITKKLLG